MKRGIVVTLCVLLFVATVHLARRKVGSLPAGHLSATAAAGETTNARLTFVDDVAPIIYARCIACHSPNGSAPFSLQSFADVSKRAEQIVEVTQSGYMPPWLPQKSDFAFANDRSMTERQIDTLAKWFETGMSRGDSSRLPTVELPTSDWQLGQPDLVLGLTEPFMLPADGPEVFRNFVLPVELPSKIRKSYVRTVEIKPGNPRAVHHVIGLIDRTGESRRRDDQGPSQGFEGMDLHQAEILHGQSMLWSPGKVPSPGRPGLAWPLGSKIDVVLQMHMYPTGKIEPILPMVGMYLTEQKPTLFPLSIMLEAASIDIPAGQSSYEVTDEITVPVPIKILSVYPHAHYLATTVDCLATLPDENQQTLLRIDQWDFNWQDEYQFEQPVELPAGSVLSMRFTYDNSDANVRNPNNPPRRVMLGNKTTDEMGSLLLQVLTESASDRQILDEFRWHQKLLTSQLHPTANQNLGSIYEARGELQKALRCYQRVLQLSPNDSSAHANVGVVMADMGRLTTAESHFRQAVELDPENALAYNRWGAALMRQGRIQEATVQLARALEIWPEFPEARANLGEAELRRGDPEKAIYHYRMAIRDSPDYPLAHFNLGTVLMNQQKFVEAAACFRKAVKLDDQFAEAFNNLGIILYQQGKLAEAAQQFRRSIELDASYNNPRQNLEVVERALAE